MHFILAGNKIVNLTQSSCRYGMETFSQLIVDGKLINSTVNIDDQLQYVHRGLMLDTGLASCIHLSISYNSVVVKRF